MKRDFSQQVLDQWDRPIRMSEEDQTPMTMGRAIASALFMGREQTREEIGLAMELGLRLRNGGEQDVDENEMKLACDRAYEVYKKSLPILYHRIKCFLNADPVK